MTYSSSLNEADSRLVLDASTLINLLASDSAPDILAAIGIPVLASEHAIREVEDGESTGRRSDAPVRRLQGRGLLDIVSLSDEEAEVFGTLVSGATSTSLGDGEAATIATAFGRSGYAVIDERKATRICVERFPDIGTATTIDIFSHRRVARMIEREVLRKAVLCALKDSRMQVRGSQYSWVVGVIGPEAAEGCPSLRRLSLRRTRVAG